MFTVGTFHLLQFYEQQKFLHQLTTRQHAKEKETNVLLLNVHVYLFKSNIIAES